MKTLTVAAALAAALIATGTAQAATWDPAYSSRDRAIERQLRQHQTGDVRASASTYDPADDSNGPTGRSGAVISTHDGAPITNGYIPRIDRAVTDRD